MDVFDFLFAADTLSVPHAPGLPLYVLLGYIVTRLPGNDAWLLSFFLSLIPTMISTYLILKIIKKRTTSNFLPYICTLIFPASMVVFSQSIIPEVYALTTVFIVLAFYFIEKGRFRASMLSLGFGLTITYLPFFMIVMGLFLYKPFRSWKLLWVLPPLILYLFVPLAIREPYISTYRNNIVSLYHFIMHHGDLMLSIPAWEFPARVYQYLQALVASSSILIIPITIGLFKDKKLLWLVFPFLLYCLTTLRPLSYWHLMPAVAFMAIASVYGLETLIRYLKVKPTYVYGASFIILLALLFINTITFDIGRTLDTDPTGARTFVEDALNLKDNDVVVAWDTCGYAGVYYINQEYSRKIVTILPVFHYDSKPFYWEVDKFINQGFNLPDWTSSEISFLSNCMLYAQNHVESPYYADTYLFELIPSTIVFSRYNSNATLYTIVQSPAIVTRKQQDFVKIKDGEVLDWGATPIETQEVILRYQEMFLDENPN